MTPVNHQWYESQCVFIYSFSYLFYYHLYRKAMPKRRTSGLISSEELAVTNLSIAVAAQAKSESVSNSNATTCLE